MNKRILENPLISVVLPVYNGSKFLIEAINSILRQTFIDFEFIIINDGSTDDSLSIIRSFSDPRIIVIDQPNKGLAPTLNIATAICRGEYIARMDSDDISLANRFETQLCFLRKNQNVSVLSGAFIYIDEKGKEIARSFPLTSIGVIKKYLLNNGCVICHPAVMMRKKDFNEVGGYSEAMGNRFTDYHLWVKFIRKGYKIKNESRIVLKYRLIQEAISSQFTMNDEAFKCLKEVLMCDEPDVQSILHIQELCEKETHGLESRVNQLAYNVNKVHQKIKFIGNDFVANQICNLKNIYGFFKAGR